MPMKSNICLHCNSFVVYYNITPPTPESIQLLNGAQYSLTALDASFHFCSIGLFRWKEPYAQIENDSKSTNMYQN